MGPAALEDSDEVLLSPKIQAFLQFLEEHDSVRASQANSSFQHNAVEAWVTKDRARNLAGSNDNLFVSIYSDSKFYNSRLKVADETWAAKLPASHLQVIGDKEAYLRPGLNVTATRCPPHTHSEGVCCKFAEAAIHAHAAFHKDPRLQWAFFADDDTYVRVDVLHKMLNKHEVVRNAVNNTKGRVIAIWACGTKDCNGYCGGGGYAAD